MLFLLLRVSVRFGQEFIHAPNHVVQAGILVLVIKLVLFLVRTFLVLIVLVSLGF